MHCPQCDTENREDARFCVECGARLPLVCAQCGRELPFGAKFSDPCGTQVTASPFEAAEKPGPAALTEALHRLVPREFAERLLPTRPSIWQTAQVA